MKKLHIWPEEKQTEEGLTKVSATIENLDGTRRSIWYRVPEKYSSYLSSSCDSFVLGLIVKFMSQSADVVIHGQVSPLLLRNLSEYQAIWHCWKPEIYNPVEIEAEREQEQVLSSEPKRAIAAFSGGVDSSFTMYRHRQGLCGRLQENVEAGLMIHGFDIPLSDKEIFSRATEKAKKMLLSLNVELITIATNIRPLAIWNDSHGAALASCLMIFDNQFNRGLIPSTEPYQAIGNYWGSHPLIDPLFSKHNFQVIHDGAAFNRIQKMEQLTQWPEALENLRVCWHGAQKDRNCGKCEKCIRTILGFRVLGQGLPPCFEKDLDAFDIPKLAFRWFNEVQQTETESILQEAKRRNISDLWVKELELVLLSKKTVQPLISPSLKTAIKKVLNN